MTGWLSLGLANKSSRVLGLVRNYFTLIRRYELYRLKLQEDKDINWVDWPVMTFLSLCNDRDLACLHQQGHKVTASRVNSNCVTFKSSFVLLVWPLFDPFILHIHCAPPVIELRAFLPRIHPSGHPSVSHSPFQVAQLHLHLSCCSSLYSFPPTLHWCVFCHPSRESYVTSPSPPAPSFSSSLCSCLSGGTQVHSSGLH